VLAKNRLKYFPTRQKLSTLICLVSFFLATFAIIYTAPLADGRRSKAAATEVAAGTTVPASGAAEPFPAAPPERRSRPREPRPPS
jgi:hypothetical protein